MASLYAVDNGKTTPLGDPNKRSSVKDGLEEKKKFSNNLDKKEEKLRDRIDEALVRLRAEGFLTELSIKWYGEDFSIDPYKE